MDQISNGDTLEFEQLAQEYRWCGSCNRSTLLWTLYHVTRMNGMTYLEEHGWCEECEPVTEGTIEEH